MQPAHYTQGPIHCIDAMVSAFGKHAVWDKRPIPLEMGIMLERQQPDAVR